MDANKLFFKNIINEGLLLKLEDREIEKLNKFEELFKLYNVHTNLMSKNDLNIIFEKHIYDSLSFGLFLKKYSYYDKIVKVMDIGTGGGFPAIPLSICFNNLDILAIDSIAKKIEFINQTVKELEIENLKTKCIRIENLPYDLKNSYDMVTSRALAPLNILLEYAMPFVKKESYFVAYKGKHIKDEIFLAKSALKKLNAEIVDIIDYNLPLETDYKRHLLIIKKIKETSSLYPRTYSSIKNNPL